MRNDGAAGAAHGGVCTLLRDERKTEVNDHMTNARRVSSSAHCASYNLGRRLVNYFTLFLLSPISLLPSLSLSVSQRLSRHCVNGLLVLNLITVHCEYILDAYIHPFES